MRGPMRTRTKVSMWIEVDSERWAQSNGLGGPTAAEIRNDVQDYVFYNVCALSLFEETGAVVSRTAPKGTRGESGVES